MQVSRLGQKAFEQCAGFLRIREGENPLDNTGIHPETHPIVESMVRDSGCTMEEFIRQKKVQRVLTSWINTQIKTLGLTLKRYFGGIRQTRT